MLSGSKGIRGVVERLRRFEGALVRVEGGAVALLVLVMLGMAGYNIVFRNLLVPLQSYWAHSGPPLDVGATPQEEATGVEATPQDESAEDEGGAQGFGGAFGEDPAGEDGGAEGFGGAFGEEPAGEEGGAEGFGGAFGEEPAGEEGGAEGFGGAFGEEPAEEEGGAEGFGGAFGEEPPAQEVQDDPSLDPEAAETGGAQGLRDQFENLPDIDPSRKKDTIGPQGGPPPPGSFAAWGVDAIAALRLDWIDVLLRHLVIIASFLGAALATVRGKHINVDALSKTIPTKYRPIVSLGAHGLALVVCVTLALAGWDLVQIGIQYPDAVTPFLNEWHMQLMFPVGFGLLAFHVLARILETLVSRPDGSTETS